MIALYAALGIVGFACLLTVQSFRRKQLQRESEAPFAIGGGADFVSNFHSTDLAPEAQDNHAA